MKISHDDIYFPDTSPKRKISKILVLLIPLFIVGLYALIGYAASRSRAVYLMNGLGKAYTVHIKGKSYRLEPEKPLKVILPEGVVEVSVEDKQRNIPSEMHVIETSFWERPFSQKVFVINPDAAAIFCKDMAIYVPEETKISFKPNAEFYGGAAFYEFKGIDYVFDLPPQKMMLYGKEIAHKYILGYVKTIKTMDTRIYLYLLSKNIGKDKVQQKAIKHLQYEPEETAYLDYLQIEMKPEALIEVLRPGLSARPVRTDWHRAYQDAMEKLNPNQDISGEYRTLLSEDPGNPELQYLLACVVRNYDEVERLLYQSANSPHPCARSFFMLSLGRLSEGRFEEAVEYLSKATALAPENIRYRQRYREALEAAGKYEEAIREYTKEMTQGAIDSMWVREIIRLEFLRGGKDKASRALDEWIQKIKVYFKDEPDKKAEEFRTEIQAYLDYYSGSTASYLALMEKNKDNPETCFEWAFSMSNLAEAEKSLEKFEKLEFKEYLLLFLHCSCTGKKEDGERYLKEAIKLLRKEGWEANYIANCLEGTSQPEPGSIYRTPFYPEYKVPILLTLGIRFPDQRQFYYPLAQKLNYKLDFPHHFVNYVVGSK